jgi:hypothetical protein
MSKNEFGLPEKLPKIIITPSQEKTFEVENIEIRWWFARPVIGEVTTWCCYDLPGWKNYGDITRVECVGKGKVHDIDCYILKSEDFEKENDSWILKNERSFFVNQTDSFMRTIATLERKSDGSVLFHSFYDESFIERWGKELPIKLTKEKKIIRNEKGEYSTDYDGVLVCDRCNVKIGGKGFDCIRVIDVTWAIDRNKSILMEAFINKEGRTILARRYNAPMWNVTEQNEESIPWTKRLLDSNTIVINGITFVHWYDSLCHLAF